MDQGEKFNVEDQGCGGVNVGVLMAEVLITLVRVVGYNQLQ